MPDAFYGLSEDELNELDTFLLYELESDEGMTIDILDGFLHALAIGPVSVPPARWLPQVWGTETSVPSADSIDRLNHIMGLVIGLFNGIIAGSESTSMQKPGPTASSKAWSSALMIGSRCSIPPRGKPGFARLVY